MSIEVPLENHLNRQLELGDDFFWHRVRWSVVSSQLPESGSFDLVDCGAGTGILGRYLGEHRPAANYRFVEPIAGLEAHLVESFGSGGRLGPDDAMDGADFVTLLDVLEHIEDDHAFMSGLAARMPVGSTLLLTVPAMPRLWSAWDVALGHYRRYTRKSLNECLVSAGFEVREVSYLFPEMIPAGILRSRKYPARDGIPPNEAEFPDLPTAANRILTGACLASSKLRRVHPAGTSLFAMAVVP